MPLLYINIQNQQLATYTANTYTEIIIRLCYNNRHARYSRN